MTKISYLYVTMVAVMLICCCCTSVPVQEKYSEQFSQVELGMNRASLRELFPKAYNGGQQLSESGSKIDVVVLRDKQYDISVDRFVTQNIYFYFSNDTLVQWGRPQDWRERDPDIIIRDER